MRVSVGHPLAKIRWPSRDVIARSLGTGLLATLVDLGVLAALVSGANLDARVASPVALGCGIAVQFVGNKLFAFRDRSPRWAGQAGRFVGVEAVAFAANVVLFDLALRVVPGLPVVPVRMVTTNVVYLALCLPLWARIFTARPARASSAPTPRGTDRATAAGPTGGAGAASS